MLLSIITINLNNDQGLLKTLASVASQTCTEFEHIIIDGGSTDGSKEVIEEYAANTKYPIKWVSEKDKGIYNGMNKGILMAVGDYIQILNSGDVYASSNVVGVMMKNINAYEENSDIQPELIYGNMIRINSDGTIQDKSGEVEYSLLNYYASTLNHDCCWIKRDLFNSDRYGLYDESLKIVADWKWFLNAIGLGTVRPIYVDVDMTLFDTSGVSEKQLVKRNEERRRVLVDSLPAAILADYDKHYFDMLQMDHLRKHKIIYKIVWIIERTLNKIDQKLSSSFLSIKK